MTEVSVQILSMDDMSYELVKRAQKALGEYSHFNSITIYEGDRNFEVFTNSKEKQFITRTIISKTSFRVLESYCTKSGQNEILIFKKKT